MTAETQSSANSLHPTPLHARVQRLRDGADPQCIARLRTGWAILGNQQPGPITGCCMLLPDLPDELAPAATEAVDAAHAEWFRRTPAHLNDLPRCTPGGEDARALFLSDLALLGDAVQAATGCERLNYLMLCNQVPALHGHVVPRFATEPADKRLMDPFAAYDFPNARRANAGPGGEDAGLMKKLRTAMGELLRA